MKKNHIILSFFLLFFLPLVVKANTNAFLIWEGNDLIGSSETTTLDIIVKDITDSRLTIAGGMISVEDPNCISIVSITNIDSLVAVNEENGRFSYMNVGGLNQNSSLVRVTIKANNTSCQTKVKIEKPKLAFLDQTQLSLDTISKEIAVINYDELMLNAQNLKLSKNQTYPLQLYVPNSIVINPNLVSWSSKNNQIASVNANGLITANSLGTTTIEALFGGRTYRTNVSVVDYMKGDVNHDGKITLSDVTLALRLQIGLEETTKYYLDPGDMNENGVIDLSDVLYILRLQMDLTK